MVLSFPLVGEDHPLRQRATGILFKSAILSMLLHALFAGGRMYVANRFPPDVEFENGYVVPIDLQPVPNFDPAPPIHVKLVVPEILIPDATPEPVPYNPIEFDTISSSGPSDPS